MQSLLFDYDQEASKWQIHEGAWRRDTNYPKEAGYTPVLVQCLGSGYLRYEIGCVVGGELCVQTSWCDETESFAAVTGMIRWILLSDVHEILMKETK